MAEVSKKTLETALGVSLTSIQYELMLANKDLWDAELEAKIAVSTNPMYQQPAYQSQRDTDFLQRAQDVRSKAQVSGYGSLSDREVETSPPMETQQEKQSAPSILRIALDKQSTIAEEQAFFAKTYTEANELKYNLREAGMSYEEQEAAGAMYVKLREDNEDKTNKELYNIVIQKLQTLNTDDLDKYQNVYVDELMTDRKLVEVLTQAGLPEKELESARNMYRQIKADNPDKSNQEVFNLTMDTLNALSSPEYITRKESLELLPNMRTKTGVEELPFGATKSDNLLSSVLEKQRNAGLGLRKYDKYQLEYLNSVQKDKYNKAIQQKKAEINTLLDSLQYTYAGQSTSDPKVEFERLQTTQPEFFEVYIGADLNGDGVPDEEIFMPQEVFEYLQNNRTGGTVFSPTTDTDIIEAIENGDFKSIGRKPITYVPEDTDRGTLSALAAVRTYEEIGDPDWQTDIDKRRQVLENLDLFSTESLGGTRTDPLGGIAEGTGSWLLRNALMPYNVTAALTTNVIESVAEPGMALAFEAAEKVGLANEADYFAHLGSGRRARIRERPNLYKEDNWVYDVADNVARNKGFIGEGTVIADNLNLEGWQNWATHGGYFVMDLVDPTLDVGAGVSSGISAYKATRKTHDAIYGALSQAEAMKAANKAFKEQVDNPFNLIGMTTRVGRKFKTPIPPNLQTNDVMLVMGDNMAQNLAADRMLRTGNFQNDEFFNSAVGRAYTLDTTGLPAVNASRRFRAEIDKVESSKRILQEYDATVDEIYKLERLYMRVLERGEDGGLTFHEFVLQESKTLSKAPRISTYSELIATPGKPNYKSIRDALDVNLETLGKNNEYINLKPNRDYFADGNGVEDIIKVLDTIYGRNIFFDMSAKLLPDVVNESLAKVSFITRNTIADKRVVPKIIAAASQSDIGQALHTVVKLSTRVGDDGKVITPMVSVKRNSPDAVMSQFTGRQTTAPAETIRAYDLSDMDMLDEFRLRESVERLDISGGLKTQILDDITESRILSLDDYNFLISTNTDRVARRFAETASLEDLEKLSPENFGRLMEAPETAYRLSNLSWKKFRTGIENLLTRQTEEVPVATFQSFRQKRVLQEYNQQLSTLQERSSQTFKQLTNDRIPAARNEVVKRYINNPEDFTVLSKEEALSVMVVGEKTTGVSKFQQKQILELVIDDVIHNVFKRNVDVSSTTNTASDQISGIKRFLKNDIFTEHGKEYIETKILEISQRIVDNPTTFKSELDNLLKDLDEAIQSTLAEQKDRSVYTELDGKIQDVTRPIIDPKGASNIDSLASLKYSDKYEETLLSAYMFAEQQRELSKFVARSMRRDMLDLNILDILPKTSFNQKSFESAIQESVPLRFEDLSNGNDKNPLYRTMDLVEEAHRINVAENLDTAVDLKNIDREIYRQINRASKEFKKLGGAEKTEEIRKQNKRIRETLTEERKVKNQVIKQELGRFNFDIDIQRSVLKDEKQLALESYLGTKTKRKKTQVFPTPGQPRISWKIRKTTDPKYKQIRNDYNRKLKQLDANAKRDRKLLKQTLVNEKNKELELLRDDLLKERDKLAKRLTGEINEQLGDIDGVKFDLSQLKTITDKIDYMRREIIGWDSILFDTIEYDKAFDDIYDAMKAAELPEDEVAAIANKVDEYADLVLRNNGYLENISGATSQSIVESIEQLFASPGLATSVLGKDAFLNLKSAFNKTAFNANLGQILRDHSEDFDGLSNFFNYLQGLFYTSTLGTPASIMRNTLSAPYIIYQTTGYKLGFPKITVSPKGRRVGIDPGNYVTRGMDAVYEGSDPNSRLYNAIAVTDPLGRQYTYSDVYNILSKAGIRNRFTAIKNMLRSGDFIKELKGMKEQGYLSDGLFKRILENMKEAVLVPSRAIQQGKAPSPSQIPILNLLDKGYSVQSKTDFTFRAGVLIKALEEGKSLEEAAALSRRSLFDYSDMAESARFLKNLFVFVNFTYQNMAHTLNAIVAAGRGDATNLLRYAKTMKFQNGLQVLIDEFNDDKNKLPYEYYYPRYAQESINIIIDRGNNGGVVKFARLPQVPAIESVLAFADAFGSIFLGAPDTESITEQVEGFIHPIIKEIASKIIKNKYEPGNVPAEYITMIKMTGSKTPVEIANALEKIAGGIVIPKPANPNKKGVVDGYVYPLDTKQKEKFYHESMATVLQVSGLKTLTFQMLRMIDPTGTVVDFNDNTFEENLMGTMQNIHAFLGLYSISQMQSPQAQQLRALKNLIGELEQMKNQSDDITNAVILRGDFAKEYETEEDDTGDTGLDD